MHSVNEKCLRGGVQTTVGKVCTAERDGGGARFNTGTVLALNCSTHETVTMNLVISRILFYFPVWQLTKKSTEGQTAAQRSALIGATEPGPRGERG